MNVSVGRVARPFVVVVVLNWNGRECTLRCLAALREIEYVNLLIVVVDNGSTDDSRESIRAQFPEVPVFETGKNLGFAGGANVGVRYAINMGAKYVWLLNNDARPTSSALQHMVSLAETNPRIGAVGSVLCQEGELKGIESWCGGKINLLFGYNRVARGPKPNEWFDYLCAGSLLIRRSAFFDVGLLDEAFFLYWEDVDFGFRLRQRGWMLAAAKDSLVRHEGGSSTAANIAARVRYSTTSGMRFLRSHAFVPWLSISLFVCNRLAKRAVTMRPRQALAVLAGIWDYLESRRLRGYRSVDAVEPLDEVYSGKSLREY